MSCGESTFVQSSVVDNREFVFSCKDYASALHGSGARVLVAALLGSTDTVCRQRDRSFVCTDAFLVHFTHFPREGGLFTGTALSPRVRQTPLGVWDA